jgi:hypothetical protein
LEALDGAGESVRLHRLEDVVERLLLERGDREFVVGGDEDDPRPPLDALGHLEARQARHLDVEEGEVGLEGSDLLGRLDAVAGDRDDLERRPGLREQLAQVCREVRLVVGDERRGRAAHDATGSERRARTPRGSPAPMSSEALLP